MNKKTSYILIVFFILIIFSLGIVTIFKTPTKISISERRELKSIPIFNISDVKTGKYFDNFESFLLDQISLRDIFRRIKSINLFYIYHQKDNHKVFIKDGYAAQITYPLAKNKEDLLAKKINYLKEKYFKNSNIYSTIIPDKAYYLVKDNSYPLINYDNLRKNALKNLPNYIDIFDYLSIESYYKTDTHWKNDEIISVAKKLLHSMSMNDDIVILSKKELSPFYGVLYGQSALPLKYDTISYINTNKNQNVSVFRANQKTKKLEKGKLYYDEFIINNDPYDIFLGGASNITVIDNTEVSNGKILYLFSDSFGRSLAPLLVSDYDKIIFIDLRYIKMSSYVSEYGIMDNSDVLFAYSIQALSVISNLQVD
jgi:hypothetical protein